jgi:4a-hydroxytetrahydrobiopterin dehydratase
MAADEELSRKKCQPCEGGTPPLGEAEIKVLLAEITGWEIMEGALVKTFRFKNYHETMAFVNATAWISHREDHHPDLTVGYSRCRVSYLTHAVGGLSENDFICAAKLDALFNL